MSNTLKYFWEQRQNWKYKFSVWIYHQSKTYVGWCILSKHLTLKMDCIINGEWQMPHQQWLSRIRTFAKVLQSLIMEKAPTMAFSWLKAPSYLLTLAFPWAQRLMSIPIPHDFQLLPSFRLEDIVAEWGWSWSPGIRECSLAALVTRRYSSQCSWTVTKR